LERQQKYQDSLQSISTKMEALEMKLSESLQPGRSPESQMAEHQVKISVNSAPCMVE
jgi:nesprin-1